MRLLIQTPLKPYQFSGLSKEEAEESKRMILAVILGKSQYLLLNDVDSAEDCIFFSREVVLQSVFGLCSEPKE